MAHSSRCMEYFAAIETVYLPRWGEQKIVAAGVSVDATKGVKRNFALIASLIPPPPGGPFPAVYGVIELTKSGEPSVFVDMSLGNMRVRIIVPDDVETVLVSSTYGMRLWTEDPSSMGKEDP